MKTTTTSVVFISYILDSFDNKNQVDVIFTNFRKTFDTIHHEFLTNELEVLGIRNLLFLDTIYNTSCKDS